jgi:hypothetical protein
VKFIQVIEGKWLKWNKRERWMCCDCSLVHRVQTRMRNGHLEVRMFRDEKMTAKSRKDEGLKVTRKRKSK